MIDLRLAVQDAVVAALLPIVTAGTMIEGEAVQVFQHAPEDTQPPVIVVGDVAATPIGGKDGGLDSISVEIITLYRGEARRFLFEMQELVRAALEGVALPAQAGALLSRPVADGADDSLMDDGKTYYGTQRFTVIAQPE